MSVKTTADESIDSAKESIRKAIKNISNLVVDACWGYEEYDLDELGRILIMLFEISRELERNP